MGRIKFFVLTFAVVISALSLSSCIDIDRKIRINADGTGTEVQTFNIDRTFYDLIYSMVQAMDSSKANSIRDSLYNHDDMVKTIKENLSNKEGIQVLSLTGTTNQDSSVTYRFEYNFNSVDKIGYATNISAKEMSGEKESKSQIEWKEDGNKIRFSLLYKPDPGDETQEEENNKAFSFLFANKNVKFNIDFPYPIESSNAQKTEGNKGEWTFPVSELMLDKDKRLYLEAVLAK